MLTWKQYQQPSKRTKRTTATRIKYQAFLLLFIASCEQILVFQHTFPEQCRSKKKEVVVQEERPREKKTVLNIAVKKSTKDSFEELVETENLYSLKRVPVHHSKPRTVALMHIDWGSVLTEKVTFLSCDEESSGRHLCVGTLDTNITDANTTDTNTTSIPFRRLISDARIARIEKTDRDDFSEPATESRIQRRQKQRTGRRLRGRSRLSTLQKTLKKMDAHLNGNRMNKSYKDIVHDINDNHDHHDNQAGDEDSEKNVKSFEEILGSFTSYAVTLRDPLDRAISAFMSSHPLNAAIVSYDLTPMDFMYECFPSLESFAMALSLPDPSVVTVPDKGGSQANPMPSNPEQVYSVLDPQDESIHSCSNLARDTLTGAKTHIPSLRHNYEALGGYIELGVEVFALRYTHLVQDVSRILDILDDKPLDEVLTTPSTEATIDPAGELVPIPGTYFIPSTLSEQGRDNMCEYLRREYEVYFRLLERSVNLSDKEVEEMVKLATMKCPRLFSNIP